MTKIRKVKENKRRENRKYDKNNFKKAASYTIKIVHKIMKIVLSIALTLQFQDFYVICLFTENNN